MGSLETKPGAALGLYVHWPYCARICPYCDFNVRRDRGQDTGFLVEAMIAEIKQWAARIDTNQPLASISFGGGTPSRMEPTQLQKILQAAEHSFGFTSDIEISLEANPTDQDAARYEAFAQMGVNRLSLGVQSFDDAQLAFLGRDHTAASATRALALAQTHFDLVSADFIYGLPDQTGQQWQSALGDILTLELSHLSFYCLSIEPGTAFSKWQQRGKLQPMPDDQTADLYDLTQTALGAAGMPAYEISNHCAGQANRSRHNLLYWQGDDWIGIGPGAHGRVKVNGRRHAVANLRRPQDYANHVQQDGLGALELESLSADDDLAERLMLGLRLPDGIGLDIMQSRAGAKLDANRLARSLQAGTVRLEKGQLIASSPLLVDRIALDLLV
ncbi:MAG: coproporphyrinogen III oxidase [Robiginitomaculum sp.]|nr:MAG: coproporphyrinogen III oxidase [Robiginitomaculum sp.]